MTRLLTVVLSLVSFVSTAWTNNSCSRFDARQSASSIILTTEDPVLGQKRERVYGEDYFLGSNLALIKTGSSRCKLISYSDTQHRFTNQSFYCDFDASMSQSGCSDFVATMANPSRIQVTTADTNGQFFNQKYYGEFPGIHYGSKFRFQSSPSRCKIVSFQNGRFTEKSVWCDNQDDDGESGSCSPYKVKSGSSRLEISYHGSSGIKSNSYWGESPIQIASDFVSFKASNSRCQVAYIKDGRFRTESLWCEADSAPSHKGCSKFAVVRANNSRLKVMAMGSTRLITEDLYAEFPVKYSKNSVTLKSGNSQCMKITLNGNRFKQDYVWCDDKHGEGFLQENPLTEAGKTMRGQTKRFNELYED